MPQRFIDTVIAEVEEYANRDVSLNWQLNNGTRSNEQSSGSAYISGNQITHTAVARGPFVETYEYDEAVCIHRLNGGVVHHEFTWSGGQKSYDVPLESNLDLNDCEGVTFGITNGDGQSERWHYITKAKVFGVSVPFPAGEINHEEYPGATYLNPDNDPPTACSGEDQLGWIHFLSMPGFVAMEYRPGRNILCQPISVGTVQISVSIVPKLEFLVDHKAVFMDGAAPDELPVNITVGPIVVQDVSVPAFKAGWAEYVFKSETPVDTFVSIPTQILSTHLYATYTNRLEPFVTHTTPFYNRDTLKPIYSKNNRIQVSLDASVYGQTPTGATAWHEARAASDNQLGRVRFHPAAEAEGVAVYNAKLPQAVTMPREDFTQIDDVTLPEPLEPTAVIGGPGEHRYFQSLTGGLSGWSLYPYRYLKLIYRASAPTTVLLQARLQTQGGSSPQTGSRSYLLELEGSNSLKELIIDTADPYLHNSIPRSALPVITYSADPDYNTKRVDNSNASLNQVVPGPIFEDDESNSVFLPKVCSPLNRIDSLMWTVTNAEIQILEIQAVCFEAAMFRHCELPWGHVDYIHRFDSNAMALPQPKYVPNFVNSFGNRVNFEPGGELSFGLPAHFEPLDGNDMPWPAQDLRSEDGAVIYGSTIGNEIGIYPGIMGDYIFNGEQNFSVKARTIIGHTLIAQIMPSYAFRQKLIVDYVPSLIDDTLDDSLHTLRFNKRGYVSKAINVIHDQRQLRAYRQNQNLDQWYSKWHASSKQGQVVWNGFGLFGPANQPATDSEFSGFRWVAYLHDGYIRLRIGGTRDFEKGQTQFIDTGIPAEFFAFKVDNYKDEPRLILITSYAGRLEARYSDDAAETWSMPERFGYGQCPALTICTDGRRFVYWNQNIPDTDQAQLKGIILNGNLTKACDPFEIMQVDADTGLASGTMVKNNAEDHLLFHIIDDRLYVSVSDNGVDFEDSIAVDVE